MKELKVETVEKSITFWAIAVVTSAYDDGLRVSKADDGENYVRVNSYNSKDQLNRAISQIPKGTIYRVYESTITFPVSVV